MLRKLQNKAYAAVLLVKARDRTQKFNSNIKAQKVATIWTFVLLKVLWHSDFED